MILESYYWKEELDNKIKDFKSFLNKRKRYTESIFVQIELFFFVTCFMVRKIKESNKLSDEIEKSSIPSYKYQNIKEFRYYMDRYEIDEHFDLSYPIQTHIEMKDLLNLGIHSFCFASFTESKQDWKKADFTIFVNTNWSKNEYVYKIELRDYIAFLKNIVKDDIVSSYTKYDKKTGKITCIFKSNKIQKKLIIENENNERRV